MPRLPFLACVIVFCVAPFTHADEIGIAEEFALSTNRAETLKQLIPGTEDYYYYHTLHFLNIGDNGKAAALFKPWFERFKQTARLTEIQTRHALLNYEKDPQQSLDYLKTRLNLEFNHQKNIQGAAPDLPTALDPKLISHETLAAYSLRRWQQGADNFEAASLDWLVTGTLDAGLRRHALSRLALPDVPSLAKIVADDLNAKDSGGFGSLTIHSQLTLAHLEELSRLKPELLQQSKFVEAWVARRHSRNTKAYLDQLLSFTRRLSPTFNSLKAHVLYNRLVYDQSHGEYDKSLFIEYLRLPRMQNYMSKSMLENEDLRRQACDLNHHYSSCTGLANVGADEELVRSYLKQFLIKADSPKQFEPFINDIYLKRLFAETMIENGLGEPERWASDLPADVFKQLKDRVDIDFADVNKTSFAADEPVKLELFAKNVPTLIIKIFEINTKNYYRTKQEDVKMDVDLEGLTANWEQTHVFTETPFRRIGRTFEFPQLSKPGVYVIDFIGGGKISRALICKGQLRFLESASSAGQKLTIVDDANKIVPGADVWLGGQEFKADDNGVVIIPFSTAPDYKSIVISNGEFSRLGLFRHSGEKYELIAGIHVDRESLLSQRMASVLIRPSLQLNGELVSVKLLTNVKLVVTAIDQEGTPTSTQTDDVRLFEDRETVHPFRVPPRLAKLHIALRAKVKNLSQGKEIDLSSEQSFSMNGIDQTGKIEDLHLARFGDNYVIEVLGQTGEAKPNRPVRLTIKHRQFKEPVSALLKSDAQGRIVLGALPDVTRVDALGAEGVSHTWNMPANRHTYRWIVNSRAGEPTAIPYLGSAKSPRREELAFFEMWGREIRSDRFDVLSIADGMIQIGGLMEGDYELLLKETGQRLWIRVSDGPVQAGYVLGRGRDLQLPALKPVQIASIQEDVDTVTIRLRNRSAYTRVHVYATRYEPAFSAFADLSAVREAESRQVHRNDPISTYRTGQDVDSEYRYVLERRGQKKFAGNMLERPSLLLNPWALRPTEKVDLTWANRNKERLLRSGGGYDASDGARQKSDKSERADFANLDFLYDASAAFVNLVPDKDGLVKIPRKSLGAHGMIHVVAVDPVNTTSRSFSLLEQPAAFVDLRLRRSLDPGNHFSQRQQVSLLQPGKPFVIADGSASRFEMYDSLAKVYRLYLTASLDPKLAEFSFILSWPTLKFEEKKSLYSKFACHELNFFLAKKDPDFLRTVIKPFLANKKDKAFLDHWLLEEDLAAYLQPWQYDRLNAVERILLAQRVSGEGPKTARHLNDALSLLPRDRERERHSFKTALGAGQMGLDEIGTLMAAMSAVSKSRYRADRVKKENATDEEFMWESNSPGALGPAGSVPAMSGASGDKKPTGVIDNSESMTNGLPTAVEVNRKLEQKLEQANSQLKRLGKDQPASRDGLDRSDDQTKKALQLTNQDAELEDLGLDSNRDFLVDERTNGFVPGRLYRRLDVTEELAENNYFKLPIQKQLANLVGVNDFWVDYARHDGKRPFLSLNLAEATHVFTAAPHHFTEAMMALAVLDLPFDSGKQDVKFVNGKLTITPNNLAILYHEEIKPIAEAAGKVQIMVSQNFYRNGDRYKDANGERFDKFVTSEFVIQTVYGCQVVVTNPTLSKQRLSVLLQVPVGAIPVANGQPTKTVQLDLEPYHTQIVDYQFYFPKAGRYVHFPVHVAKGEALVAAAAPFTFNVVDKPSKLDTESWEYVSQNGTADEVVAMMNRENINALDLEKIAFRMRDKAFFETVLSLLKERHTWNATLWSYALLHNAPSAAKEYLTQMDQIVNECGGPIDCPLLTVDPIVRHQYEHLGYKPLINARAHALGQARQIVNGRFHEQYSRFVKLLSYRAKLTDMDQLELCYYLLLQDRVEEATNAFASVHPEKIATRMQYDYCAAYLDMFNDEPKKVRAIIAPYINHPVERWRNAFTAIANQLDEFDGKAGKLVDKDDQAQQQAQLAAKESSFEFGVAKKTINLTWKNVETVRINYYLMDVELLFSRNPFVQQSGGQFSMIRPNQTKEYQLPNFQNKLAIPMPEELADKNVLVEITANGKTRSVPILANAMHATLNENYGQLQITDAANDKPLAKVYVKTYVRLADGTVKFHKDGYTDHRGKFDYASVSTPDRSPIAKFGILVLSETQGALIGEVAPPQQ